MKPYVFIKGTNLLKIIGGFLLFMLLTFSISSALTTIKPEYRISSSSVNTATNKITGEMLYHLLGWENHHFMKGLNDQSKKPTLMSYIFKLSTNINLDDPRSLLGRELPSFSLYDSKIIVASEGTDYTNMPMESTPPLEVLMAEQEATLQNMENLDSIENKSPNHAGLSTGGREVVYLYFTHNTESYLPYLKGVTNPNHAYHSQLNVTKIGDKLKEELESRGIGTNLDKTDIYGNLLKKGLDFEYSYQESRPVVQAAIASSRDLQYFIDIHRDAKRKEHTTLDLNGKKYAKLAFVVGAEHPNYEKNLQLAKEMHDLLNKKYPGLSRAVIKKEGKGTNGKFNQDLSSNAMLIEFGGVDNTFEELNLSAEALADVFSEFYWQAEKVSNPVTGSDEKK